MGNEVFLAKSADSFGQAWQVGAVGYVQVLNALRGGPSFFRRPPQKFRGCPAIGNGFGAGTRLAKFEQERVDL